MEGIPQTEKHIYVIDLAGFPLGDKFRIGAAFRLHQAHPLQAELVGLVAMRWLRFSWQWTGVIEL